LASVKPGIAGDPKRMLSGIRAYIDPERWLVFIENEKNGQWMLSCPHCSAVYWYTLGESMAGSIPQACADAINPPLLCPTCQKRIAYDQPWQSHEDCEKSIARLIDEGAAEVGLG